MFEKFNKRFVKRFLNIKNNENKQKNNNSRAIQRINKLTKHLNKQNTIIQKSTIPIINTYDVIVVGGGPSGICAAIAASRTGVKTLIIERYGCFGGVITTVGMETLGWYRYEGTIDSVGLGTEIEKLAKNLGASRKWPFNDSHCLDTEKFKIISDKLLIESGVEPLLHTKVTDVLINKDNIIYGVIIDSKSGKEAILGKRIIDCTGDADLFHYAGARYTRLKKDKAMGVTTVINLNGIDKKKFLKHIEQNPKTYANWSDDWDQETTGKEDKLKSPYLAEEFKKAISDKIIDKDSDNISLCGSWSSITESGDALNMNIIHMRGYNATNKIDLTKAEMEGRKNVERAINALNYSLPGFENAKLRNIAMTLGIRDTRKILGKYNLTSEDVKNQGRFYDSIGIFPEFIDGYNILILPTTGRYFQIPSRALMGDINNLLAAGRCVAGDFVSHAATRNMMCCCVTGQGAGVIAAISVLNDTNTFDVDIKKVQEELKKQNVRFL